MSTVHYGRAAWQQMWIDPKRAELTLLLLLRCTVRVSQRTRTRVTRNGASGGAVGHTKAKRRNTKVSFLKELVFFLSILVAVRET